LQRPWPRTLSGSGWSEAMAPGFSTN